MDLIKPTTDRPTDQPIKPTTKKQSDVYYLLDINSSDEFGKTPLHCAAASQNVDAVMYLIERKANVNVLDDREETPLHAAVRTGNVSLVNVSDLFEKCTVFCAGRDFLLYY